MRGIRDRCIMVLLYHTILCAGELLSAHAIYDVVVKYVRLAGLDDVSSDTLRHSFRACITGGRNPAHQCR